MPILSIEFALFFLIFFPVYWLFRTHIKAQNILLLLASLAWLISINYWFALAVLGYGLGIHFIAKRIIQKTPFAFTGGVVSTLLFLSIFKYSNFYIADLQSLLQSSQFNLMMPLGISYYCFQGISYLHTLKEKGKKQAMGLIETLCFFSFFPTITTGPILRGDDLRLDASQVDPIRQEGLKKSKGKFLFPGAVQQFTKAKERFLIQPHLALAYLLLGTFKVWVLSSFLGDQIVNPIFQNPAQYTAFEVLIGIYGYTFELYFNFSGSIDLVIGLAMLLGFQLPPNFAMPLIASNLREFWNRWHITLSTWIRDYIYIPLGGNRYGFIAMELFLFIAMLLSGIWHGSGWNFALWGALHGIALMLLNLGDYLLGDGPERLKSGRQKALHTHTWGKPIAIFFNLQFVAFTFVIFNTNNLDDAWLIFSSLGQNVLQPPDSLFVWTFAVMVLGLIFYPYLAKLFYAFVQFLQAIPMVLWILPIALILFIIITIAPSGIPSFIYANF
ncbi:MBOAT family O-acyltransferase [Basilea psittacipulmonis]|uniref:Probable alginate O-acetylase AlgI n=1 Tax=Basilea psittacipulmonis DSM 24701 TaxID=1072685 RepID=A0A077DG22_9BURK|nr:MBOAT family O-acyltransferase [Basilea psittacipulmonis]AIL33121.1 hypothetical protein IX83_07250 [Basilea psittacipulmonis DSM 24701]